MTDYWYKLFFEERIEDRYAEPPRDHATYDDRDAARRRFNEVNDADDNWYVDGIEVGENNDDGIARYTTVDEAPFDLVVDMLIDAIEGGYEVDTI